jgi:hypothetical protein
VPLRQWFTEKGHPGWYSWVVVVGAAVTSSILSIVVSISTTHRSIEREREARAAQEAQSRRVACQVIVAQDEAFRDTVPATKAGVAAAKAWRDLRTQFRCDER